MQEDRDAAGVELGVVVGDDGTDMDGVAAAGFEGREGVCFAQGREGAQGRRGFQRVGVARGQTVIWRSLCGEQVRKKSESQRDGDPISPRDEGPMRHAYSIGSLPGKVYCRPTPGLRAGDQFGRGLVALANAEDGAGGVEEDFEEGSAEEFAGERVLVDSEGDEAGTQFAGEGTDGAADGAGGSMDVGSGRDDGLDLPADGSNLLWRRAERDGLDDGEARAGGLADAEGQREAA